MARRSRPRRRNPDRHVIELAHVFVPLPSRPHSQTCGGLQTPACALIWRGGPAAWQRTDYCRGQRTYRSAWTKAKTARSPAPAPSRGVEAGREGHPVRECHLRPDRETGARRREWQRVRPITGRVAAPSVRLASVTSLHRLSDAAFARSTFLCARSTNVGGCPTTKLKNLPTAS